MTEQRKNKTLYVTEEKLEQLQEGQDKFNFSKRVNALIELGLYIEEQAKQHGITSTEQAKELIELGVKAKEGSIENKLNMRIVTEYMLRRYNSKNPDNPIRA